MTLLFANNALTTLSATANVSDTALVLAASGGALFPSPGAGQSFRATIQNGTQYEIVECTGRSGDTLTVVRAREGTAAQTWASGSSVSLRVTGGCLGAMLQSADAALLYAPINGPISLSADPADPTHAVRESYLDGRETAIRSDLGQDISDRGALVGEAKEYYGISCPALYVWANGAALSRTTYAELFDAITRELTVTITSGSPVVTITAGSVDGLAAGMSISCTTYFAPGTTISSIGSGTLTLSTNALLSNSGVELRVCPQGAGNDTTTFNAPDRRGRVPVGRDNMGGSAASRVTFVNAVRLGIAGGDQTLQDHTHAVYDPGHNHSASADVQGAHSHTLTDGNPLKAGMIGLAGGSGYGFGATNTDVQGAHSHNISVFGAGTGISIYASGGGSGQNLQPLLVCNVIVFANA